MYYLESFCFLCLKPGISTTLHNIDVEEKLEYLISTYQVLELSKISKHFCDTCLENLNSFYDFKQKCVKSIVISNYYVQKLNQENDTFAYLSVGLSDILQNIKLGTINSVDANVESTNRELNNEIFATNNYEQHETVEIQQDKANKEQVSIKIKNEMDYLEKKRDITEELIIKDENFDNSDNIFECKTCMLSFSTEVLLIEHLAECIKSTRAIEVVYQIHNDTESVDSSDTTEDTSTNIGESSQAFSRLDTLKIYQCSYSDIKLIKRNVSKKIFSQKCNLKRLERIHTGQKPYKYDVYKKNFNEKAHLNQHKCIHIKEKSYECDVCKKSFSRKYNLIVHKRIHTGEKPYECDVCKKSFSKKSNLFRHIHIHTGEKPYECDVCKESVSRKSTLDLHYHIHTGEKPYECDVCKKSFSRKSILYVHKRIHTGEKPYKCDVCWKSFNQKTTLNLHKRIHTGEKPNECDVCKESFSRKSTLDLHYRIHTGEKPYECDVCKRTFSFKCNLKKHKSYHSGLK